MKGIAKATADLGKLKEEDRKIANLQKMHNNKIFERSREKPRLELSLKNERKENGV